MRRPKPKLPNEDSARTTFHYNTRSSSRKGLCTTHRVDESAPVRVSKPGKKKKVSDERSKNSDPHLPIDLITVILKRLPVKTLARFLCVSKHLGSIIRSPYFMKLFLHESSNRPGRLFFNFQQRDKVEYLFSSNTGQVSVATHHLTLPTFENTLCSSSCVHDLICYRTAPDFVLVVYNSTTKRSITLPKLEPLVTGNSFLRHFLGFEPIDGVYKVLCVRRNEGCPVFTVLTLGNGNEWRMIEDIGHLHFPLRTQICTNGVIYYGARADCRSQGGVLGEVVISFDLRSEKFHLIKGPATADFKLQDVSALTKYEGKLAFVSTKISADGTLVLWVLEDAIKHQWLKKIFVLPNSWTSLAHDTRVTSPPHKLHSFLNITVAGEFILAPFVPCVAPFYVLYYDPKRNIMRKVSIQGILEHELLQWSIENIWFLYKISSSQCESLAFW